MCSCKLTGNSEATPQLALGAINITENDTLGFYGDRLDSVYIGDTIQFYTQVYSQYNEIKEYYIKSSDTASVKFLWGDEAKLDSIFVSHGEGKFVMDETANMLSLPFKYIIRKPKEDLKLTFSVLTNASMDYNSRTITIITPMKERKGEGTGEDKEEGTERTTE